MAEREVQRGLEAIEGWLSEVYSTVWSGRGARSGRV